MAQVLVIGNGGREHAYVAALAASPKVEAIYCSPGNAGTATHVKTTNVGLEYGDVVKYAQKHNIDLVVIGPEAPLIAGVSDALRAANIPVFGPSKAASKLEYSKAYAAEFMVENDIPLPPTIITHSVAEALAEVERLGAEASVIKADGLAGGKGVVLPSSIEEAREVVDDMFSGKFDHQGETVVIQERYHGPEVSAFALSDGTNFLMIPIFAQDHKRLLAGDKGPNTGGMGVYAPLPSHLLSDKQIDELFTIAAKTFKAMARQGTPYQGVLYIGAMLADETSGSPIMIEYNARFGDPEAEVILPLLTRSSVDMYDLLLAVANQDISSISLPSSIAESAITICLAADGYPANPNTGEIILGLDDLPKDVVVYHGATSMNPAGGITSAGGRVVYVTAFGSDLNQASQRANAAIGTKGVHFAGMQYRTDIGYRAM